MYGAVFCSLLQVCRHILPGFAYKPDDTVIIVLSSFSLLLSTQAIQTSQLKDNVQFEKGGIECQLVLEIKMKNQSILNLLYITYYLVTTRVNRTCYQQKPDECQLYPEKFTTVTVEYYNGISNKNYSLTVCLWHKVCMNCSLFWI